MCFSKQSHLHSCNFCFARYLALSDLLGRSFFCSRHGQKAPCSSCSQKRESASGTDKTSHVEIQALEGVPYVREKTVVGDRGLRKDQANWKRTLADLLKADHHAIVQLLVRDGLRLDLAGTTCPRCGRGSPSKLTECQDTAWKHKCSSRNCRVWLNPYHLHPVFCQASPDASSPSTIAPPPRTAADD